MVTPFLVTGCGRSGTKWAADLFTALGYPCGHEALYSYDREGPLTASESSWLAVPHLDSVPPSTRVLRVLRDPFKVVQSAMSKGFLLDMADPYGVYVALHRPDIALGRDHLTRVIRYVALWDEPLDSRNVLRVDGNTHMTTGAVRYATGEPLSRSDVGLAREAVGASTNTTDPALRLPAPTVGQIENGRDGDLITARAERFGYERGVVETHSEERYKGNHYAPGLTGTATVLGEERVYGMWQQRVDGVMFFALAKPIRNTVSQHWTQVSNFRAVRS